MYPRFKLRAEGRGRAYSRMRGVVESTLNLAYPYSWPAALWSHFPGATRVQLIHHRLRILPASPHRRPALRLAFVSDLHIGPTTPRATLDQAFNLLAELRPDVLALGGDYVFLDAIDDSLQFLEQLVARVPAKCKLAVLGNHDLWTRHERIEAALQRGGAQVLVNQSCRLPEPFSDLAVVGLDDPWTGEMKPEMAFMGTESAACRIALCHSPSGYPAVEGRQVSLLLSGHTHGGQIALPGARPIVLPPGEHCVQWPYGLHQEGSVQVFVSRGIGATELPMRFFAPPDIALFTLEPHSAPYPSGGAPPTIAR